MHVSRGGDRLWRRVCRPEIQPRQLRGLRNQVRLGGSVRRRALRVFVRGGADLLRRCLRSAVFRPAKLRRLRSRLQGWHDLQRQGLCLPGRRNDLRRRVRRYHERRHAVWSLWPRLRLQSGLQRRGLHDDVRERPHELQRRLRRYHQQRHELRHLRSGVCWRQPLHRRALRLCRGPHAMRRLVRGPSERSHELRRVRADLCGKSGLLAERMCHDVPDRRDGLRLGVREHRRRPWQLRRLWRRLYRRRHVRGEHVRLPERRPALRRRLRLDRD
jgi:hypothetical protein